MRAPQAYRIEFLEDTSVGILPGIVVGNEVIRCVGLLGESGGIGPGDRIDRLSPDGMTPGSILVDVDPENAGEETLLQGLTGIELVVATTGISYGEIEKSIISKGETAAVVPIVGVVLIDQHDLGAGDRVTTGSPGEPRQSHVGLLVVGFPGFIESRSAFDLVGIEGPISVVDEEFVFSDSLAITRVNGHSEQSAIAIPLGLRLQIEQLSQGRDVGTVLEGENFPTLVGEEESGRVRDGEELNEVNRVDLQVGEGLNRGVGRAPIRVGRWGRFGEGAVQKWSDR